MKKWVVIILILLAVGAVSIIAIRGLGISISSEKPVRYEQLDLGEYVVNLRDDHRSYLRTQIVIEYIHDKETENFLNSQMPKARDKVISILRGKSAAELAHGDNLDELRGELISGLEDILNFEEQIVDLWFVLFMIQ